MKTQWGLIVEEVTGYGSNRTVSTEVVRHFIGTREEALNLLKRYARAHKPEHPKFPQRTLLYRTEDGFLLVNQGAARTYGCRFSIAELLYHSDADDR